MWPISTVHIFMAVILETSKGDIVIDLFIKDCPAASKNFLKLCKCAGNFLCLLPAASSSTLLNALPPSRIKYYNNCLFHSVQRNFIAQTGDPEGTGRGGSSISGYGPHPLTHSHARLPLPSA